MGNTSWGRGALGLALVALLAPTLSACGPRYARLVVEDDPNLFVELRAQKVSGGRLDRGFSHPVTISAVRLTNILSRIDVRKEGRKGPGERRAAIPTESLREIGKAASTALTKADATQEVVVRSVQSGRRLGIFTDKTFTGLVLWVEGDLLFIYLTHVDGRLERSASEKLPEPWPKKPAGKFRIVPGPAMDPVGPNALTVAWRDPLFRRSGNVTLGADGRLKRRTILLEEAPEQAPDRSPAVSLPADLSPETLRELADLEDQRLSGAISEADYRRRRRELMGNEGAP